MRRKSCIVSGMSGEKIGSNLHNAHGVKSSMTTKSLIHSTIFRIFFERTLLLKYGVSQIDLAFIIETIGLPKRISILIANAGIASDKS